MSKSEQTSAAGAAQPEWMQQMMNPQVWQSMMTMMQNLPNASAMPSMPNMPVMPAMPNIPNMPSAPIPANLIPQEKLQKLQQEYGIEISKLWADLLNSHTPEIKDRRFSAPAWHSNALHAFNASVYLLNSKFMNALVEAAEVDAKTRKKIRFATQQTIDAMSPLNFFATNPEAQEKMLASKGESLTKGIMHILEDMRKGHISQTDETAFEVGVNVATSEGAVVFENDLIQLIQYRPLTKKVHARPLLIVPPCINKYYILDLQPDNSLIRYAVEQGNTVFVVSWVNPHAELGHKDWDDYVQEGVIDAINVVKDIGDDDQINALGFCVGGTLVASAVAVLAARNQHPVASLTLLTSMLDFSDVGPIDVYVDEAQVAQREQAIGQGGLMPGRDFGTAFSSLRSNDLVWNYVQANYLKGEDPPAFDLLYWNSDSTNLPGPMFCYYLRNMYLENNLRVPGRLRVGKDKVDLGKVQVPAFIYGSRDDHIVPWITAYQSVGLINTGHKANNQFVLGASGHIAGVVNPPAKKKRSHWINKKLPNSPEEWLEGATEHAGSWWTPWSEFLAQHAGPMINAPKNYGNARHKLIEPAPGRYVKVKAE